MKIIELQASNFARLVAVEIRPDGELVQITGANQQGKTSVLHAIWTALAGRAAAPAVPIHEGAEEARIHLDMGDVVVTRTFKRDRHGEVTSDLKVVLADGTRVTRKPQEMIDALLGDLSFDPLAFAKAKPEAQFDALKGLVPGFDFDAASEKRDQLFTARTDLNRIAKQEQAAAGAVVLPPGPEPREVDVSALVAELQAAGEHNAMVERDEAERARAEAEADTKLDEAERLRARAASLEKDATAIKERVEKMAGMAEVPVDVSAIRAQVDSAQAVAKVREAHTSRRAHQDRANDHAQRAKDLTFRIDALDHAKRDAIAKAKLPVDGLSLADDNSVLFNGVPFAQAGTAEKLRTSIAVGMALNPKLRVMLVDEGSELDSRSLKLVADMAAKADFQVWVARVDETGQTGFVIEDGHVVSSEASR